MNAPAQPRRAARLEAFSRIAGALAIAMGVSVFAGWAFDIPALKRVLLEMPPRASGEETP